MRCWPRRSAIRNLSRSATSNPSRSVPRDARRNAQPKSKEFAARALRAGQASCCLNDASGFMRPRHENRCLVTSLVNRDRTADYTIFVQHKRKSYSLSWARDLT
jgi:hypothetical protein